MFIGSTKGFDELYPANLSVISEKRLYDFERQSEQAQKGYDLSKVRRIMNQYHVELETEYPEIHMEKHAFDTISIIRQHKSKTRHLTLIARCFFPRKALLTSKR